MVRIFFIGFCLLSIAVLPGISQDIPLPNGAAARLGLGAISYANDAVKFSPDSRYLAVATSLGIELRDSKSLDPSSTVVN